MTILDDFVLYHSGGVEVRGDHTLILISRAGLVDELDRLVRRFPADWTAEDAERALSELPQSLCGFIVTPHSILPYGDSAKMMEDWDALTA